MSALPCSVVKCGQTATYAILVEETQNSILQECPVTNQVTEEVAKDKLPLPGGEVSRWRTRLSHVTRLAVHADQYGSVGIGVLRTKHHQAPPSTLSRPALYIHAHYPR
jgi:hypothetical protein